MKNYGTLTLNPNARLEFPSTLLELLPSTPKPVNKVYTASENPWSLPTTQQNDTTEQRFLQGLRSDFAVPTFTDKDVYQEVSQPQKLQHPIIVERPFDHLMRTTRPPRFSPIPIPEVLRPKKIVNLPLKYETANTPAPYKGSHSFSDSRNVLRPPSQLSDLLAEKIRLPQQTVNPSVYSKVHLLSLSYYIVLMF